jgi:hypothetical protein
MKRTTTAAFAAAFSLLLIASPVMAKDYCLADSLGAKFRFTKFKLPKKPGAATTLQGARIGASFVFPVGGTVVMLGDGTYAVVVVSRPDNNLSFDFHFGWNAADATLAGTANIDADSDGQKNDIFATMTATDCASIVLP